MADENLHGLPINSLPKADELNQTDQLIAYREDDGKAYRSNVGALAEASTANIGDAFATTVQYNAGDYCIYNDTLYKFTDFKDIGSWDDSVVEKVTVADEVKSNTEKIQENTDLIDSSLNDFMFTNVAVTSTAPNIKISPYTENRIVVLYSRRGLYIIYVTAGEVSYVTTASSSYSISCSFDGGDLIITPSYTTTFAVICSYTATISNSA